MTKFIAWNSQPADSWADRYAEGQRIQIDGLATHYIQKGTLVADRPPVILLHGYGYDSSMWSLNIDCLAQFTQVIALDLWGFGYSGRDAVEFGYPLYVEQIKRFMQVMALDKAIFVGHSLGAGAALSFACEYPQHVSKLVLCSAYGLPNSAPLSSRLLATPILGSLLLNWPGDGVLKKIIDTHLYQDVESLGNTFFNAVTWSQKIKGSSMVVQNVEKRRFFDSLSDEIHHLEDLEIPVSLVWGRQDKVVPFTRGEHMQRVIPGAELTILEEAGHLCNIDQAEQFNQEVVDFLAFQAPQPTVANVAETAE